MTHKWARHCAPSVQIQEQAAYNWTAAEVCYVVCFRHLNCDWCWWVVVQYKYKISPSSHLHLVWTHQVTINNLSKWPPDPRILILSTKKLRRYNEFSSSVSICYQHLRIQVEKRDECLTPAAQIERLTKPGHTYRNLNPFEVLQVYPNICSMSMSKQT